MAALADTDSSVLDDQLDTEKLMAEMGMADADVEKPQIVESGAPEQKPSAKTASSSIQMEDDLLAEFKDMDFQSAKNPKGS
jgi:ribosome assembly protein YihI (activator of Der GTPase)